MAPCPTLASWAHVEASPPPATTLYLTRHGESLNNLYGRIGGDAALSPRGEQYSRALASFIHSLDLEKPEVWVTPYTRTLATSQHLTCRRTVMPGLGEIRAGQHDGLTYEQIAEKFPTEFALRDADKLAYRYPGGESYLDVVERVQPLLKEMRRRHNLVVISHQATLRCLLSLLLGTKMEDLPYVKIPLHTVLQVDMAGDELTVTEHRLPVDCVDTHRARPDNCETGRGREEACVTVPAHL